MLEDIQQGCFRGKDCIPSIDNPNFLKINEQNFMKSNDLIIGINLNNIQKAYPIKILNWHEIVNDNFENTPIVITYCPLCASSLAFERTINTKKVEFGVSGKLYNSDLIMYDRLTETYWSQIEGKAIVGELTGQKLKQIPVELMEWKDWIKVYPNTLVLSKETGYKRNYESYPYGNYETSEDIYFPIINKDTQERFHEKTLVYGIELNDQFKAYPKNLIDELKSFDDEFAETTLHFEIKNNLLTITDKKTNKEIQKISLFWFAWFTFHPGTEIFSVTNG
ncbi:DUF3179 domain-containing protein [Candidatus Woesearchaeota archaeon]|nr:DUF3179 domain-containing protein [Candidatus Woesearchaeota archaeon]